MRAAKREQGTQEPPPHGGGECANGANQNPGSSVIQTRAIAHGKVAAFWEDPRTASAVGAIIALCLTAVYLETISFHVYMMQYGAGLGAPGGVSNVDWDWWTHSGWGMGLRQGMLALLAVVFVTLSGEKLYQEGLSLGQRTDAIRRRHEAQDYVGVLIEVTLLVSAVATAFLELDREAAVLFGALVAAVVWRLVQPTRESSSRRFVLELTGSLGVLAGVVLLGWRCASEAFTHAPGKTAWHVAYRPELEAFWLNNAAVFLVILIISAAYLGYLVHGIGNDDPRRAQRARAMFPWVGIGIAMISAMVIELAFLFIGSDELQARCTLTAEQTQLSTKAVCTHWKVAVSRLVHVQVFWMLGAVATGLLYGIVRYATSDSRAIKQAPSSAGDSS